MKSDHHETFRGLLYAFEHLIEQHEKLLDAHGKPFGWGRIETETAREVLETYRKVIEQSKVA